MQSYYLRNLAEIAEKKAVGLRQEAQLWDILSRDIRREAGRREEKSPKERVPKILDAEPQAEASIEKIFVRINEAAKMMGISRSSLYKEINSGNLKVKKSGRNTLIAVAEIKSWAKGLSAS